MGAHLLGTTPLTDDEVQQFRKQLQEIGPKWSQLAEQLNKSATLLKTFYFHYKKKYGFDQAVNEYYKVHANEDRRPVTDGDESDVSVTSSDDNGSETTRNESESKKNESVKVEGAVKLESSTMASGAPMNLQAPPSKDLITTKPEPSSTNQSSIDDRLLPPLGQPPPLLSSQQIQNFGSSCIPRDGHNPLINVMMRTKKHSEDYDSSATETADEENESSPANRQSPKATSVFTGKPLNPATTISMVPTLTPQQNGPPSNVRDAMLDFIERSLKNNSGPPKNTQVPPLKPNPPPAAPSDNNPDITFVGAYRHEGPNKIQIQPQRRSTSETLATLSIVNAHNAPPNVQSQQMIGGHPLNISSIAATITPVPPPQQNQQRPSSNPHAQEKDNRSMKVFPDSRGIMSQPSSNHSEPEPQTLDLSIKKPQQQQQQPQERFTSFAKAVPPPPTGGSIYRGDPSLQAQPNIPNQATFLAFHPDMNRHPSKSPSTYIPPSLSPGQRILTNNPHLQQQQQQQQQQQGGKKVTPKLSPKVHHQQQNVGSVQQMNGPKGSITLGTPLTDNRGQPIMIQGASNQSPRYDIMRQTPPSANDNKFGSITAGTPIHISDKRVHEYMKNSRHSPATNQQNVPVAGTGSPHPSQQFTSPYRPSQHSGELNSTQALIFSDYLTSQQMQGHNQQGRGPQNMTNTINIISGTQPGRSEKESPSPRNMGHPSSPASMYYSEKERERPGSGQTRAEYLSRSSPADHQNR